MPDHGTRPESDRNAPTDAPSHVGDGRALLPPGAQALAPVAAEDEPLLALPPPAYRNLLVISTRHAPGRVESLLQRAGHDLDGIGVVPVTAASIDYDGPLPTAKPVRPTDLTGIGIRVSEAAKHFDDGWVLLDALTLLLMYAESSRVHRFTSTLMANLAAKNVRGVYCLCPDAVEDATVEQFRSLFDAEIELDV